MLDKNIPNQFKVSKGEYPSNTDTAGEFVWTTKQSVDVEQRQVVQIRLLSQQHTRIFVLASQTVSGDCDHCLQPVLQHTIDHEHNASPPPIRALPHEGVQGLGNNNQQDVDVIEVDSLRCIPAPS